MENTTTTPSSTPNNDITTPSASTTPVTPSVSSTGSASSFSPTSTTPAEPAHTTPVASVSSPASNVGFGGSSAPNGSKKNRTRTMMMLVVGLVMLVLLAGVATVAVSARAADKKSKDEVTTLKKSLSVAKATTHDLPADAIKVSECIPNMGYHYLPAGADKIYGPFLLVSKVGRVIGVEYMFDNTMMTPIPKVVPPVELILKDSPMYGWTFDHTEMSHAPQGHDGFLKDHNDIHNYTVTPEIQKQACV